MRFERIKFFPRFLNAIRRGIRKFTYPIFSKTTEGDWKPLEISSKKDGKCLSRGLRIFKLNSSSLRDRNPN